MKRCRKCGEDKPLSEFGVQRQGVRGPVYRPRCNACNAEDRREWYARDPERGRQVARDHRERTGAHGRKLEVARARKSSWMRKYGITPERYTELLVAQHGVCAVCHQPETAIRGTTVLQLAVDHNHLDGQVRGLLCHRCNQALGHLDDSAERIKALLYYLETGGPLAD